MKVKFLKNHLNNKAGDHVHLDDRKGQYLQRMNVVGIVGNETPSSLKAPEIKVKETKVVEPAAKETKVIKKVTKKRR